jgi:hypothetical protein
MHPPLHPMMRKAAEIASKPVNFMLNLLLNPLREAEKNPVEPG